MRIGICNENNDMRIKIRETLCKILQERKIRYEIVEFRSGIDVKNYLGKLDILVLDVFLPIVGGLELREQFEDEEKETRFIYVTRQCDMMQKAFGYNVIGFVEFGKIKQQLPIVFAKEVLRVEKKVFLKNGIDSNKIVYIKAQSMYSELYLDDETTVVLRKTLKELEDELDCIHFVRIHRSYLVNLNFVQEVSSQIILFGKKLPVAERRRKEVMERYIRFCNKMRQ